MSAKHRRREPAADAGAVEAPVLPPLAAPESTEPEHIEEGGEEKREQPPPPAPALIRLEPDAFLVALPAQVHARQIDPGSCEVKTSR